MSRKKKEDNLEELEDSSEKKKKSLKKRFLHKFSVMIFAQISLISSALFASRDSKVILM